MAAKQVRVTDLVAVMVDELVEKLSKENVLIGSRQDVIAQAVSDLHKREFKGR